MLLTDGCAHAQWAAELDTVSRALAAARPDLGLFVVNCPLHVAVVEQNSYVEMKVGKLASLLQLASFVGKSCQSVPSLSGVVGAGVRSGRDWWRGRVPAAGAGQLRAGGAAHTGSGQPCRAEPGLRGIDIYITCVQNDELRNKYFGFHIFRNP